MKTKYIVIAFVACIFALAMSSCSRITDAQITAFEKSIDKLEQKYKDLTPSELQKGIDVCEKQLEMLEGSDRDYTKEQTKRIANLKGRYQRLLLKIELYTLANEIFDTTEGESVLEYIRGLLLGTKAKDVLLNNGADNTTNQQAKPYAADSHGDGDTIGFNAYIRQVDDFAEGPKSICIETAADTVLINELGRRLKHESIFGNDDFGFYSENLTRSQRVRTNRSLLSLMNEWLRIDAELRAAGVTSPKWLMEDSEKTKSIEFRNALKEALEREMN